MRPQVRTRQCPVIFMTHDRRRSTLRVDIVVRVIYGVWLAILEWRPSGPGCELVECERLFHILPPTLLAEGQRFLPVPPAIVHRCFLPRLLTSIAPGRSAL